MNFKEWYETFDFFGTSFKEHFSELIAINAIQDHSDIGVYMKMAYNAGLKAGKKL